MKKKLLKILIILLCFTFNVSAFAETEEEVVVVTNVPYEASITKKASTDSSIIDPVTGVHSGLATVFDLLTNGGDDHFDYVITSYIDIYGGRTSAYGNDGRLLFAHETSLPRISDVDNAKMGVSPSKNVFAYPTTVTANNGMSSSFYQNYKDYGNCHVIRSNGAESSTITHNVLGTPSSGTYELGIDQAGNYRSTIVFTISSK